MFAWDRNERLFTLMMLRSQKSNWILIAQKNLSNNFLTTNRLINNVNFRSPNHKAGLETKVQVTSVMWYLLSWHHVATRCPQCWGLLGHLAHCSYDDFQPHYRQLHVWRDHDCTTVTQRQAVMHIYYVINERRNLYYTQKPTGIAVIYYGHRVARN